MKIFWTLFFFGVCTFSCNNKNAPKSSLAIIQSADTDRDFSYEVYKIDSINNFYLIYAKKSDSIFKIVSSKTTNTNCESIKLSQKYNFSLHSIWTQPIMIGNVNVSPSQTPHVTGLRYDDSTTIWIDRAKGIYDLYSCDNLQGLCYLKKK